MKTKYESMLLCVVVHYSFQDNKIWKSKTIIIYENQKHAKALYCTQTLRQVICTRVLRLILAASVYADLTILCGVTKGLSQRDKLLKIWHQKLTAFYFQIYVKSKKKVVTKHSLVFFCQIKVKSQPFPPKKCIPKRFVVFCLNLVENKNINKVLTERLLLFSRNLLAECIFPLLLQT